MGFFQVSMVVRNVDGREEKSLFPFFDFYLGIAQGIGTSGAHADDIDKG